MLTDFVAIDEIELVAISNHTSLTEGETALLACVGFGLPSAQVTWLYQGQLLENSSLVSVFEEDVVQDGRVFRQSILQLCSVEMSDSGSYVCVVSNGLSSANYSVSLLVTPPQGQSLDNLCCILMHVTFSLQLLLRLRMSWL